MLFLNRFLIALKKESLFQCPRTTDDAFLLTYKNISYDEDVHLYVDNDDNNIKLWRADTGNKESSGVTVVLNDWYHVVLTSANGNQLCMYVNGQMVMNHSVDYTSTGTRILISSNYSGSIQKGRVNGVIDAVRFYNRPLSSQEALALYQSIDGDTICGSSTTLFNSVVSIPNIFTPNSDGENDNFKVQADGIGFFESKIYNRWGELVYESYQINEGWNGYTKSGNEASVGTYFYIIKMEVKENGKDVIKIFKGPLSLMR